MDNIHSAPHLLKKLVIMIIVMPLAVVLVNWLTSLLGISPDLMAVYISAGTLAALCVTSVYNYLVSKQGYLGVINGFVRLEQLERDVDEIKKELVILRCESDKETILENAIRRDMEKRAKTHDSTN